MKKTRGATIIELLVAMSIFLIVTSTIVVLLQNTQTVYVWGNKKNDALRANRELIRRVSYLLRPAITRPAFGAQNAQPAVIAVTDAPARETDPTLAPFPAGHVEFVDYWVTTETSRRLLNDPSLPVPSYPNALSYDPRSAMTDLDSNFSRLRLAWAIDTGNLTLELRSNDGTTVTASRAITSNTAGFNVIRAIDFRLVDTAQNPRSIRMFLETRSRDPNSRVGERRYSTDTQFQLPGWTPN